MLDFFDSLSPRRNAAGAFSYLLPKGICLFIMWSRSRSQLIQLNRPAGSPSSSVPAAVSI